jgi:hypothetical protein
MKAVLRTGEHSALIAGPGSGVLITIFWLAWIIYVLTALVIVFAIALAVIIVLWLVHDWKAYKVRRARRLNQEEW